VIRKVAGDLGDKASVGDIRNKLAESVKTAKSQLLDEV
jgi:hypothetical protein